MRRKLLDYTLIGVITLALLEAAVRFVAPQPQLYPRFRYSERFGHELPTSTTMVHEKSGAWRFTYTTNEYGFRASMPPITNRYDRPNVVVLGDSCTFGQGVNDGEEYSALLARRLDGRATVVNLGVPGFGLTHEIRTFYEFGLLFQPALVLLQFYQNDLDDNLLEKVTTVADGRFVFQRDHSFAGPLRALKNWLSDSVLQHSSAYNMIRYAAYSKWRHHLAHEESAEARAEKEAFYNELLTVFAEDLHRRGIRLVMFDVPRNLAKWPGVESHVRALQERGLVELLDSSAWFKGLRAYASPEGHPWGALGHRVVADNLAPVVRAALALDVAPADGQRDDLARAPVIRVVGSDGPAAAAARPLKQAGPKLNRQGAALEVEAMKRALIQ
jgi:GDSL-like lipase/acylhydrolase family protein